MPHPAGCLAATAGALLAAACSDGVATVHAEHLALMRAMTELVERSRDGGDVAAAQRRLPDLIARARALAKRRAALSGGPAWQRLERRHAAEIATLQRRFLAALQQVAERPELASLRTLLRDLPAP